MSARVVKLLGHFEPLNYQKNAVLHVNDTKSTISMEQIKENWDKFVGKDIGTSSWKQINQSYIDLFGKVIFVPTDNTSHGKGGGQTKGAPFAKPVIQGFYVLSLLDIFLTEVTKTKPDAFSTKYIISRINYGFNKVRFIAPAYVDGKLRGTFKLKNVEYGKTKNYLRCEWNATIQAKNKDAKEISTVCVAEFVVMLVYSV
eukprot:344234_1